MNAFTKYLLLDKIINLSFLLSLFFLVLYLGILLFTYHHLPPLLPIFNQMPWGIPRVGTREELFIPFGIAAAIFIINTVAASLVYQKLPLVARMLAITYLFAGILALLFLLRTLLVALY